MLISDAQSDARSNEHHSRVGVMAISDNINNTNMCIYIYMIYNNDNNNNSNNNSNNTNNNTNEHHSGPGVMLISDAR